MGGRGWYHAKKCLGHMQTSLSLSLSISLISLFLILIKCEINIILHVHIRILHLLQLVREHRVMIPGIGNRLYLACGDGKLLCYCVEVNSSSL